MTSQRATLTKATYVLLGGLLRPDQLRVRRRGIRVQSVTSRTKTPTRVGHAGYSAEASTFGSSTIAPGWRPRRDQWIVCTLCPIRAMPDYILWQFPFVRGIAPSQRSTAFVTLECGPSR